MNTTSPTPHSVSRAELEDFLNTATAQDMAQRFTEGFVPMMDAKIAQTVQSVVAEEFPKLASDDQFIERVMARLTPDVIEEQRFVFLAKNPNFPFAKA